MLKHIVTTIAATLLASSAFSQTVLKDELKSLKEKKEAAYQQAEQAKLDQVANINKKYFEVLKQLLLKAKVSGPKDNELTKDIKRELAALGHFEPEDWCYGTWKLHRPGYGEVWVIYQIDFNGSVHTIDQKTEERREVNRNSPLEVLSDSKVTFKAYLDAYEVQKIATGKVKFILITETSRVDIEAVRQ